MKRWSFITENAVEKIKRLICCGWSRGVEWTVLELCQKYFRVFWWDFASKFLFNFTIFFCRTCRKWLKAKMHHRVSTWTKIFQFPRVSDRNLQASSFMRKYSDHRSTSSLRWLMQVNSRGVCSAVDTEHNFAILQCSTAAASSRMWSTEQKRYNPAPKTDHCCFSSAATIQKLCSKLHLLLKTTATVSISI